MKRILKLTCLLAVAATALMFSQSARPAPGEDAAIKLWKSLTDEQKQAALLPLHAKNRYDETFPPVKRPGVSFDRLTGKQKKLVNDAIRAVASEYGAERILKLATQGANNRRYLTFFGTPAKGKPFAWRMAQHHLTVLYAEFGAESPVEFGPVLLGGNPVKTMWDAEDQIFLKLYASLSKEEQEQAAKGKGIRIGTLNDKSQSIAEKLLAQRLAVVAPYYRKNFEIQLKKDGGIDNLFLSIKATDASRSHHQGGRYTWKLAGQRVLCDWQTRGNEHIHMTLHAFALKKKV